MAAITADHWEELAVSMFGVTRHGLTLHNRALSRYMHGRETITHEMEDHLLRKNIQLGPDWSIVQDEDWVYHVRWHRVVQIDYFHGFSMLSVHPSCQLMEDEEWAPAHWLVRIPRKGEKYLCGAINRSMMTIQRKWGKKLSDRWKEKHHEDIVALAQSFVNLYEECKKTGDVLPSLDYDRKLLERRYGSPWKELRAAQRERDYWARKAAQAGTGDVQPSLDYERKLSERKYGSPWKEECAAQRNREAARRKAARAGTEGFWDLEEFEVTF